MFLFLLSCPLDFSAHSLTQTDRQAGRQTERQTDRETDRRTKRERGRQTAKQTDKQGDKGVDAHTDRAMIYPYRYVHCYSHKRKRRQQVSLSLIDTMSCPIGGEEDMVGGAIYTDSWAGLDDTLAIPLTS